MIIVTGASGFIGRHLLKALCNKGYEIFACTHRRRVEEVFPHLKGSRLDLTKASELKKLPAQGVEAVFHLASFVPESVSRDVLSNAQRCLKANILATLNVLEHCRLNHIKRLVYASTISIYQNATTLPSENTFVYPTTLYGLSKLAAEMLCEKYRKDYGLLCFSLRFGSIYGLGQPGHLVMAKFIQSAIEHRPIEIWGKGKKLIDFVYIKDVVKACLLTLKAKKPGIYNIGSGEPVAIVDLARTVRRVFADAHLPLCFTTTDNEDVSSVWLDITKARRELGFQPSYTLLKGLMDYKRELKAESLIRRGG